MSQKLKCGNNQGALCHCLAEALWCHACSHLGLLPSSAVRDSSCRAGHHLVFSVFYSCTDLPSQDIFYSILYAADNLTSVVHRRLDDSHLEPSIQAPSPSQGADSDLHRLFLEMKLPVSYISFFLCWSVSDAFTQHFLEPFFSSLIFATISKIKPSRRYLPAPGWKDS